MNKSFKFRLMRFVKGYTVIDFRNEDRFESSVKLSEGFVLDFRNINF